MSCLVTLGHSSLGGSRCYLRSVDRSSSCCLGLIVESGTDLLEPGAKRPTATSFIHKSDCF